MFSFSAISTQSKWCLVLCVKHVDVCFLGFGSPGRLVIPLAAWIVNWSAAGGVNFITNHKALLGNSTCFLIKYMFQGPTLSMILQVDGV